VQEDSMEKGNREPEAENGLKLTENAQAEGVH
jgi:hypothetical protein